MPECNNCGGFVTTAFVQVFGDNTDTAHGCLSCTSNHELAAQTREYERGMARTNAGSDGL